MKTTENNSLIHHVSFVGNSYRSGDGSARDEVGTPRAPGPEGPAVTVQGSYAYNSPAGPVQVQYVADENGYQPAGPNVHPAIIKAVAQQVIQLLFYFMYY